MEKEIKIGVLPKREKRVGREARCYEYQYLFFETSIEPEFLSDFSNDVGMGCYHSPNEYNEEILDLQEELMKTIWKIAKTGLTKHQFKIVQLMFEGKTQVEAAKILGVQQSTIHKSLHGSNGVKGSYKKLKRLVVNDIEIINLLSEIRELTNRRF